MLSVFSLNSQEKNSQLRRSSSEGIGFHGQGRFP